MSIGISIDAKNTASAALRRLGDAIHRPEIRKVMGRAIANKLRRHLAKLDRSRPNKLGGQRTHFYAQARGGVQQPQLTGDGVAVAINHVGIAQRYFGGDIVPREVRFLTIPVHPAAYGRRAREFGDALDFVPREGKPPLLVDRTNPDDKSGLGEVYYVLLQRVHQEPDPTVLPTSDEISDAAGEAGYDYLAILIQRARPPRS